MLMSMQESCKNPFFKCKGDPTDIKLYITSDKLPICKKCWEKLADGDYAWDA